MQRPLESLGFITSEEAVTMASVMKSAFHKLVGLGGGGGWLGGWGGEDGGGDGGGGEGGGGDGGGGEGGGGDDGGKNE